MGPLRSVAVVVVAGSLALGGWAVGHQSPRADTVSTTSPAPTQTIDINGHSFTVEQLAQAFGQETVDVSNLKQQVAADEASARAGLGVLADRSGCAFDRDVDGNEWYSCTPATRGAPVTIPITSPTGS